MKVVWICHFSNHEIQSSIDLWKNINEFSSWIPNTLKGFENRNDVELHVISPHQYLKKFSKLTMRNIQYYFIPYGIPIMHRHWPRFFRFDFYSNFYFVRRRVKQIIHEVQPDIINLIGTENITYSFSIFDFQNIYPIIITIQGFINQFNEKLRLPSELKKRIFIEEKILRSFKYFCGEQDSSNYITGFNPRHTFFKLYFPVNEKLVNLIKSKEKIFDCIYFGKLSKSKGTEDFIKVIALLKEEIPNIKGCIVGSGNDLPFKKLSSKLGCESNINFLGFAENQLQLFQYVNSSRVFLAPPYKERLSSTIRETMFLKVPIVAYSTGGIPYINEFDENIYLVGTGDFKEMANKTKLLLRNEDLRNKLAAKAYLYAVKEFGLENNVERLISAYQTVIKTSKDKL